MPRPQRCLCQGIKFRPNVVYFKPQGVPIQDLEVVELSMEEIESYRLRHIDDLDQKESAERMHTSQSTYQRILNSAYKKIADFLINGKAIKVVEHEQFVIRS
ncbi:MAG: hypothetical protein UT05_C0002G0038 [Parcubacteria group bacterium GW2011_GWF2_38_76]|nr:MAG: hypothetical protein UT05_C0002G0038 [Parcubacteria group bacterium GW2011_GWF2_38_76]HBM45804.1 hypothetical protein [Patescibacteria group bacterium]